MKIFLLDLWSDLREKRLWPVAVVLLLGLVAVPVILARPAEEPSAPPVAKAAPDSDDAAKLAALAKVKLGDESTSAGSTLGVFDPDNPFAPPKGTIEEEDDGTAGGSGPGSDTDSRAGGEGGAGPTTEDTGSTGGTTSGGTTTGGGTTGGGTTGGGTTTTTTAYKYVVDVAFTANGRARRMAGLQKLEMLPSQVNPLLIFMGVTENAGSAVFLVDSTLEAAGEGKCRPSRSNCAFLYLGAGSEHEFTTEEGESYTLAVEEIRKVKVGTASASAKDGGPEAGAALGAPDTPRRFVPPVLADLVTVSSTTSGTSNRKDDSR